LQVATVASQAQVLSLLQPLGKELFLLLQLGLVYLVLFELFLLLAGQSSIMVTYLLLLLCLLRELDLLVFLLFVELLSQVVHLLFFLGLVLALRGQETVSLAPFVFPRPGLFVEFGLQ